MTTELSASGHTSWWRRPGGGREAVTIATPLIVSSLSWTIMTFVDRMLLNHWSGAAMSAAFMASTAWFAVLCLPLGVCTYTGVFVAQYHGADRPKRIGPAVWQGVWIALAASPLMLAVIPFSSALFSFAGHGDEVTGLESSYFAILCWGAPALLLSASLSCFYSGRGKTSIVMVVDTVFAMVNLLLDYWWIFGLEVNGQSVFPAMGIEGAGWATVASLWGKTFVYFAMICRASNHARFATRQAQYDKPLFRRMFSFGWPSGVQLLLDVVGFTMFILLVGRLGQVENEATSLAFSISSLAFMPVCGLGMAASILVGQHLGENKPEVAEQATWTTMHLAWGYMLLVSGSFVLLPEYYLAGFYSGEAVAESDSQQRAAVAATAMVLMRYVAIYNFLDAMLIVFVSAVKGAGDTRFVLWVSLAMATLLAVLSWLAVEVLGLGLYGCWALVSAWIAGLGVIFYLRFRNGSWKKMRVIEPFEEDAQEGPVTPASLSQPPLDKALADEVALSAAACSAAETAGLGAASPEA